MSVRRIANFATSRWSGGETRQLYIYPPECRYADRDFIFRLSTATVESATSDFTPLPDYMRLIAPIEGTLHLSFGGARPEVTLRPMEVCAFDGGWHTRSAGKVRDFNLMFRKGAASSKMMGAVLTPGGRLILPVGGSIAFILVWCEEGSALIETASRAVTLNPGELGVIAEADCAHPVWVTQTGHDPTRLMAASIELHSQTDR